MVSDEERKKEIERFLAGVMDAKELRVFSEKFEHDSDLRSVLEKESGIEALLLGSAKQSFTDRRFSRALERAVGSSSPENIRISWIHVYALAASLLLVCMGAYFTVAKLGEHKHVARVKPESHNTTVSSMSCESKSIRHLTGRTLFLSEAGTKVNVVHGDDSTLNVVVAHGNVCFDMAHDESRVIIVATPHTAIALGGTVTRVVVTELETEVAVLEGTAEVIHRYNRESREPLKTGSTVFADFDKFTLAQELTPEVCENRTMMFRKYITWVQKQANS